MSKTNISIVIALVIAFLGSWYLVTYLRKAPQPVANNLTHVYTNNANGFSIHLPSGYIADESYTYQMDAKRTIRGAKFTIPKAIIDGTNLGNDTYISVERMPNMQDCIASNFLYDTPYSAMYTENGTAYSVASTTGAAAGNRYEETVYAIPHTNPCFAVRYFVHYSVFENYPAGTVREFNKSSLLAEFDLIRSSLVIH